MPARLSCLILFVTLATHTLWAQPIRLIGQPDYLLTGQPQTIVAADFNGDGRMDIAVTDGSLSVLLQAPDGSFEKPVDYPISALPSYMVKGDFNHDGFVDLAVADQTAPIVSVLLGKGDGTFQAAVSYQLPMSAAGLALADVNRDQKADIVVLSTSSAGTQVTILAGLGNGTFHVGIPRMADSGTSISKFQMADLNGDGKADAVFLSINGQQSQGWISVLLGNGDGTFVSAKHYPVGPSPAGLALADFNGDGIPDLVSSDYSYNYMPTFLGNGDGTFRPGPDAPGQGNSLSVGDFNGDGKWDLAVMDNSGHGFGVLAGNGDGTFAKISTTPIGPECCRGLPILVGDFNADRHADLVVGSNASGIGFLSVFSGRGDGTFEIGAPFNPGFYFGALSAGDVNGDGKTDLVGVGPTLISTFLGNGDGTYKAALFSPSPGNLSGMTLGRFNVGAIPDLVGIDTKANSLDVLLGNGRGYFGNIQSTALPDTMSYLFRGDFNQDGIADVVVGSSIAYISLGKGDGTFSPPTALNVPGKLLGVGDFNGDGHLDILLDTTSLGNYSVSVLPGNGDGTFGSAVPSELKYLESAVGIADFNHDGKLDLAVAYQEGPSGPVGVVLLGAGDGSFANPQPFFLPPTGVLSLAVADFNRDGNADLAAIMDSLQTVILLPGDGKGHFGDLSMYGLLTGPLSGGVIVADLNDDGRSDVLAVGRNGSTILFEKDTLSPK